MSKVNKADLFVKKQILSYFLIYQTRWQVLFHLFLSSGNGYEWKDGEPTSIFDLERKSGMNDFIDILEKNMDDTLYGHEKEEMSVAYDFHLAIKTIIENNIDILACSIDTLRFEPFIRKASFSDINNFIESGSKHSLIYQAYHFKKENPDWKIDEEWKTAILEVTRLVNHLLFTTSFDYMSDIQISDPSGWRNEKHFHIYHDFLDMKYTFFPEDKEIEEKRRAASLRIANKIMEKERNR